jgi:4-hydroxy-3-polyprenylbenzoate decarboxylase
MGRGPVVLALTGASGAPYGVRLLEVLVRSRVGVWLVVSSHGWRLLEQECGIGSLAALRQATGGARLWDEVTVFDDGDRGARPASGSARTQGMIVCPCSMGTLSAIAHGTSRSLVERAADVTLKERRRLILVTRETPLSLVHARNIVAVTEAGATVMPAAPGFYHRPARIEDLVDFIVQRVLDHLDVEASIAPRWEGRTHKTHRTRKTRKTRT